MIANIANNHFIEKIKLIRRLFNNFNINPLEIIKYLIPRNPNVFIIPLISINETKNIIKNLKNSYSCGHDELNSII